MYSSTLYQRAPVALQSVLITLRSLSRKLMREGRRFEGHMREVAHTQNLAASDLAAWQETRLGKQLRHAALHVPFYRDLGFAHAVADSSPTEALAAFPLIDKAAVREHGGRLIADNARRPLFKGSTSGTTGSPLVLWQDLNAINRENAFIWRQLEWAGLRRGDRRAWLRGDLVVPADAAGPPFWRMNHAENMLMLSSYHLAESNVPAYIAAMERFDPIVIQAYPSSIAFLAKWLDAAGRTYGGTALKGIVTSSETLNAGEEALIAKRFGCRVFDWYGQSERVAAIGTCEHGRKHVIGDYSFVEFLQAGDGLYEIVGTCFSNLAMPLVRYRTGDYVKLEEAAAGCECGRHFPLVAAIQGRVDDAIKLPDGRHVVRLGHIFKGIEGILEAQIRQEQLDQITIMIVAADSFSEIEKAKLNANARDRLGSGVGIRIAEVSSIPRSKGGKLRSVVCTI